MSELLLSSEIKPVLGKVGITGVEVLSDCAKTITPETSLSIGGVITDPTTTVAIAVAIVV